VPFTAASETFYVSPAGDDANPGTETAPWQTIGRANGTLVAGDTVLIRGGTYDDPIRPLASGTDDDNRVTYRAFGDGPVILVAVGDLGGNPEAEGAIGLGGRRFVTVDGGPDRLIRAIPGAQSFASLGNFTNAQHCVVDSVVIDGSQYTSAGANLFLFNYLYSPSDTESSSNVLRNSWFLGRATSFSLYTEDIIQVAGNAHHNVIENNLFDNTFHVSVNLGQGVNQAGIRPYANVVRDNEIVNRYHTALSLYPGGPDNLVEGNTLIASGGLPRSLAGPGNALQYSSEAGVIRHNLIAFGGAIDSDRLTGGLYMSTGGDAPGDTVGNRVYNNTIVRNEGDGIAVAYWADPGTIGKNAFLNNIVYGNNTHDPSFFPGIGIRYEETNNVPGGIGDNYQSNLIGNRNGVDPAPDPTRDIVVDAFFGSATAAEAETFVGPDQPQFVDILQVDPGFVDYGAGDFRIRADSSLVDAGAPLTNVAADDSGQGTILRVDDANPFQAAEGFAPWLGVLPDHIVIGSNPGRSTARRVEIVSVDKTTNRLVLAEAISRAPGEPIWLWSDSRGEVVFAGARPDIGAFEYPGD